MATTTGTYSFGQLRALAITAGIAPEEADMAAGIALAESSGQPGIISPTGDYGLWQINPRYWPQFDRQKLLEPAYNARAMAVVARTGRGWAHWTTYRNGTWRSKVPTSSTPTTPAPGAPATPQGAAGEGWDWTAGLVPGSGLVPGVDGWVEDLTQNLGKVLLSLLLGSVGLSLTAYALVRLTASSDVGKTALQVGGALSGAGGAAAALTV